VIEPVEIGSRLRSTAGVLVAVLLLAGCAAPAAGPAPTRTVEDTLSGSVTVFAAASLTEAFGAIADEFTAEHPGVNVTFNFGGSSALATQIAEGAPVDVFAAASGTPMSVVTNAGLVEGTPTVFATNTLEIATPADNPAHVTGLADFANAHLSIALCAVEVPCGAAAKTALDAAGITPSVDTYEQDVKAVLTKVELGEIDAGLVYKTDVLAAGKTVEGIEFPEAAAAIGTYPIAQLSTSTNPEAAAAFIAYVLSSPGIKILSDAGFGTP
jgi:molybdate transport system substrate-binding protein